jgi:hypothetical protein
VADLAISVRTASDDFEALPQSYALALAPYWLISQPRERFADWADASGPEGVLRAMSLSVAASTRHRGGTTRTRMATGVRTSLRRPSIDPAYRDSVEASLQRMRAHATFVLQQMISLQTASAAQRIVDLFEAAGGEAEEFAFDAMDPQLPPQLDTETALAQAWAAFVQAWADDADDVQERLDVAYEIAATILQEQRLSDPAVAALLGQVRRLEHVERRDLLPSRLGLHVDVAGALAWEFEESVASSGRFRTGGGWLNVSWVERNAAALFVLRATGVRGERSILDAGGRLVLDTSLRVSPSVEGMVRWRRHERPDTSLSLIFETTLGRSNSLVFAFGRNFQPDLEDSLIMTVQFLTGVGFDVWFGEG